MLLGKVGVKIVWGYTKVNARILLGGNSVGVHSFLPVKRESCCCKGTLFLASYYQEEKSAGVHSFLPVSKLGGKSAGVHSFFPVLVKVGRAIVWGYTLSCLLVNWERRVQGYTLSFQY